jgi:glycosyltransferase involved in cell wall biosynthesis
LYDWSAALNKQRPPVTFLMPVRNGDEFLENSLRSIENQSLEGDEILIINDHSTDRTPKILEEFSIVNQRITVLNTSSPGLVNALNLGIRNAQHDLIARFDVDDLYMDKRISCQTALFDSDTVAVFSDYSLFSDSAGELGLIASAVYPTATSCSLIASQRTPHSSAIFSRDAVIEAGGYRIEDFPAEDLSLWLRLARLGHLRSVPEALLKYRLNPLGITSTRRHEMLMKKESLLQTIRVNPTDIDRLRSEALEISTLYSNDTHTSERRILLAKDMLAISRRYEKCRELETNAARILAREFFSKRGLNALSGLSLQKYQRRRLR